MISVKGNTGAVMGNMEAEAVRNVYERIFQTKTGKRLFEKMYF